MFLVIFYIKPFCAQMRLSTERLYVKYCSSAELVQTGSRFQHSFGIAMVVINGNATFFL